MIETLERLVPPPSGGVPPVDWAAAGLAFPADYRRFVDRYGAGSIGDYLDVLLPEPLEGTAARAGMQAETRMAVFQWGDTPKPAALEGTAPRLIAWAVDGDASILCWDATGPDPDRWVGCRACSAYAGPGSSATRSRRAPTCPADDSGRSFGVHFFLSSGPTASRWFSVS
ncbi:hypothetical protein [Actinoplanes sp. NPDC023714]|uniref:hypothetical protein n=1 Tax=Actinoplanes sp. NPDC023714 TaxID=3154322 RepID=UPI00340189C4